MHAEGLGCVLVFDGGRLLGVFTERDVLGRVVADGRDGARTRIADVMTPDPDCLTPDDGIAWALNRMVVGGFRHVPLLDPSGRPAGVVSMRHIVEYLVDAFPEQVLNIAPNPSQAMPREREGA
jgi:CBS domain-containing protein